MDISALHPRARLLVIVILMAISFAAGYASHFIPVPAKPPHQQIRLDTYRYISPLLDCEVIPRPSQDIHPDLGVLDDVVDDIVEAHLVDRTALSIRVYFRELNSGMSFGRNELDMIAPGSLLKVAMMIAILKRAELDVNILRQKIGYDGRGQLDRLQYFKPKETLRGGASYTVEDLLFRMIAYSDNNAMQLLVDRFGMAIVDSTLEELNVPIDTSGQWDHMSVRNYTAFFRILYNASYLTNAMSEKAMEYLVASTFSEGIRSGVPKGVSVASKFGESGEGWYSLSEFGIVFYPDHPFLLGVSATGGSPESLAHAIREVSRAVYREMERQHAK